MLICAGFLFFVFVIAFVGIMGGSALWLLDLPSLVMVVVPLALFLFVSKSGGVILGYIKSSFKKDYPYTKPELKSIAVALKNARKLTLAAGGFGFMAGIILALGSLSTPEHLGPHIAVSLISVLYAITISYFVFFPVQAWAENEINSQR